MLTSPWHDCHDISATHCSFQTGSYKDQPLFPSSIAPSLSQNEFSLFPTSFVGLDSHLYRFQISHLADYYDLDHEKTVAKPIAIPSAIPTMGVHGTASDSISD